MSFSFKYRKWRQEQHNSSTSHFCKSFRLPTVLTFPRDYKTWTPGVETQLNPSLIWLILVTGRGNHETKAAMSLNSRGNHVSGQSLKHQSVSICPWLYPMVPAWKGKLQQLTVLLTNRNGGKYLGKARKERECDMANPSQTGRVFSPFTFILCKQSPAEWQGFRTGFKERVSFKEVSSCFLWMQEELFLPF